MGRAYWTGTTAATAERRMLLRVLASGSKVAPDARSGRRVAMVEEAALEAIGLFKRYGDRSAVRGVDLVVRAGEVHGLLGPNGAGKTTLLRMLLGLVRPDAGTVRVLGEAAGATTGPLPDGVAGFVDTPRFYPYLTGRRNLRLVARLDRRADGTPKFPV